MLRKSDFPKAMINGLKVSFTQAAAAVTNQYPLLCLEVPSDSDSEDYGWIGQTPGLSEWIDERKPKALLDYGFRLKNKDYESSISVHRNTIADQKLGQVTIRVQGMGTAAKNGYDNFCFAVLEEGDTKQCYDGQNFFDTDHQSGESGVQKNVRTSTTLNVANCQSVIAEMEQFKDDQGEIAGVNPSHIIVPSSLQWKANAIFNPQGTDSSLDQSLRGRLEVVVVKKLVDQTSWYIADLTQPMKPLIYQNRQELEFDDTTNGEANFHRKEIHFGVDARFAFGYGIWYLIYKCTE